MLYLLDASIFLFRGWFALPDSITTAAGEPANAFRGFATTLVDLLPETGGQPLLICFDESLSSSFRNEIDPDYKANRELPPPELECQFRWARTLSEALGLPVLASDYFEADDLMASAARLARDQALPITLISRDKDLAQLLRPGDYFWEGPGKAARDRDAVAERFGFPPERMADYLALVGDPVDNIPGVPGIGAKTAARLFSLYSDLDALYADLDGLLEHGLRGAARLRERLQAHREVAFRARALTRLRDDAPLPFDAMPPRGPVDPSALNELDRLVGLGRANRRKLGLAHA